MECNVVSVFMNMCTCMMVYVHMCASVHRAAFTIILCPLFFLRQSSLIAQAWLGNELQGSACLHLPSTGVTVTGLLDFT